MNDIDLDPFCEIEFWSHEHQTVLITNPLAATTGVFMSVLACVPILDSSVQLSDVPFMFYVAKASVFVTGIGTFIFHSMSLDYSGLNVRNLDWMPMVLMGLGAIFLTLKHDLIYFSKNTEIYAVIVCTCALLWMVTSIMLMDSATRPVLVEHSGQDRNLMWANFFLLLPFVVLLGRLMYVQSTRQLLWPGICWTLAAVIMWALNSALCRKAPALFFLHALYHPTITLAYLHLIAVATHFSSRGQLLLGPFYVWPRLCYSIKTKTSMFTSVIIQ